MATVSYPADRAGTGRRARWLEPGMADAVDALAASPVSLGIPRGSVDWASPRRQARTAAGIDRSHGDWPVVLFSPGFGSARELNAGLVDDLASRGYVVVSMSHTHESVAVEFPGGRVEPSMIDENDPTMMKTAIDARIGDTRFVLDELPKLDRRLVQAGTIISAVHLPPPGPVRPRQLPAAPGSFTGRSAELAALDASSSSASTVKISAICGTGGIGKTSLALRWAYQHLDGFPDGQLFVDLHGFDPNSEPMAPAAATRAFLDALGVAPSSIPAEPEAQTGLYRSLVAGRRMLIVLDNARDADQVISLLPGSPSCTVLVTSRRQLPGLVTAHDAHALSLNVLTHTESERLFAHAVDPARITAEPEAVAELLTLCAGLPLALTIVAARAAAHPTFPLATLAQDLRDARLDTLDGGDLNANLRAVFFWSYQALSTETAMVFGLVGLAPGPDLSLLAAIPKAYLALGSHAAARRAWQRALELYHTQLRAADAERVHHRLGRLLRQETIKAQSFDDPSQIPHHGGT